MEGWSKGWTGKVEDIHRAVTFSSKTGTKPFARQFMETRAKLIKILAPKKFCQDMYLEHVFQKN